MWDGIGSLKSASAFGGYSTNLQCIRDIKTQKLIECLKRLDWPLTLLERGNVLFQGRIIFSRNLILKICVLERKKKERKKIVLHIMILFICYLCFQLPFFFLQISNFVHCFSCFWYATYAMYQVEKFVSLVRKSSRSLYYFKEDVLESLLDLCDAVRIVNKSC